MVRICDSLYTETKYDGEFAKYPYPLSDFQKYAIEGIIEGQHVLVTAHTGSGKTLPAEFAIQHFVLERGKKVIYTSPIKALSNQKFYEFSLKYPNISFGLLTGDIKTNPNADVLIMTTEILMNYLFARNSQNTSTELSFQIDIENELACVVFDEVHYINDADRGQTWEQTILMLPYHIQMVMLSATIDNPAGFATWIENRDSQYIDGRKSVYLASTNHRVVPLTHYGFFATSETPFKNIKDKTIQQQIRDATNKLILMKTSNGKFNDAGYYEIKTMADLFAKNQFYMKRKFVLNRLMEFLKQEEMLPAIVFVFSRKSVEQCAHDITTNLLEDDSKVPYIVRRECEQIVRKFPNFKEYMELPEYNDLVSLLEKGIGIHHSGMIPVLREIVELMISKKYIKLLFATESFAIGLDCPIKTAVFSALKKFDGTGMRYLMPHEYTQMAGRAGRRGIDTVGHVVHCNNLFDLPSIMEYKEILCGKPQKLVSKFKISYQTVFNLMKHGQTEGYHTFVNKSMLKKEVDGTLSASQTKLEQDQLSFYKKAELMEIMRTPIEVCKEYMNMEENVSMYNAKKRKECERNMGMLKDNHKWLLEDIVKVREYNALKKEIVKETQYVEYMEKYAEANVDKIRRILYDHGFITLDPDTFTSLGLIASNINEIHPLVGAQLFTIIAEGDMQPRQIVSILSMFVDIRVQEDHKRLNPTFTDSSINRVAKEMKKYIEEYATTELNAEAYTGIQYDELMTYDLVDEMGEWCNCDTETGCKYFIQERLGNREISLGDFTKAVLKVVVITKEFINICEILHNIKLLHALKSIEPLICKFVATSQSLYV